MTTRGKNLMAALTLTLLPLVWLWPSVFGGKTFVPFDPAQFPPASMTLTPTELETARADANLDVTEVWPWLLPEMRLIQRDLGPFELSDWNPHARTGSPLHEAGVHGPLYPPHWLWRGGMRPRDSLVWIVWINLALAGLFTYGLLRHVRLPPLAAWFGAITFQLSGVLAANGFFWTRQPGLVWLPGMLWALLRLADGDRLRPGALAATAVAVAMPWLAGFPPYAAAGLVLTSLLAFRLVLERAGLEGGRAARLLAIRLLLGLGLGLLLAMPQLLPSAWFYAFEASRTANPTLESVRAMRFDGYGLLGYLMPDAFGHPVAERELPYALQPLTYLWCDRFDATGKALLPNYNYTEYSVFAGTLGALLGLFGLARGHGHMRGTVAVMLTVIFGLALFVPVVRWLNYLPLVKNVFPMRWLGPGSLFVAWMAAIGFARLAEVETKRVVRFALFAFALAILAFWLCGWPLADHAADPEWPGSTIAARYRIPTADAIAYLQDGAGGVDRFARAGERFAAAGSEAGWWLLLSGALLLLFALIRPARARGAALGALALASVVQLGLHGHALLPGQRLARDTETPVHEFLRRRAAADPHGGFTIARAGQPATAPTMLPPGQLMARGLRDLNFYNHGDGRSIEPLRALLGNAWSQLGRSYLTKILPPDRLGHPLFDLLGVRYVLSTQPLAQAGVRVGPSIRGPGGGEFYVYERATALPRAYTVSALRRCGGDEGVLTAMIDPATRYDDLALVAWAERDEPPPSPSPPREVRFLQDDPTVVELDIAAGAREHLVLTDTWFPGWRATIDGAPAVIERCNHSMRLVRLPNTACRVRFEFHSVLVPWGVALGLSGLLGLLLAVVLASRRRPTSSGVTSRDETAG